MPPQTPHSALGRGEELRRLHAEQHQCQEAFTAVALQFRVITAFFPLRFVRG
jgi:hypothetical protein